MHHPPLLIWVMLFLLSLASALVAGYGATSRSRSSWLYVVPFAATTAIAVYVILDVEFPRVGLVRLDASDYVLTEVLERMK
jgi:cytochrome c oxidase subunit IV